MPYVGATLLSTLLLRRANTRATHFFRHIFHLRQPIFDVQYGFLIIYMDAGLKKKIRNAGGIYICERYAGMLGKDMSATRFAPLPITIFRAVISADGVCALGDLYHIGIP